MTFCGLPFLTGLFFGITFLLELLDCFEMGLFDAVFFARVLFEVAKSFLGLFAGRFLDWDLPLEGDLADLELLAFLCVPTYMDFEVDLTDLAALLDFILL